jgi:hypothetical protein
VSLESTAAVTAYHQHNVSSRDWRHTTAATPIYRHCGGCKHAAVAVLYLSPAPHLLQGLPMQRCYCCCCCPYCSHRVLLLPTCHQHHISSRPCHCHSVWHATSWQQRQYSCTLQVPRQQQSKRGPLQRVTQLSGSCCFTPTLIEPLLTPVANPYPWLTDLPSVHC